MGGTRANSTVSLVSPDSPRLWDAARRMVEEYAASLKIDLGFQDFAQEVEGLPVEYGPPSGYFLLASVENVLVGCGAFRSLSASDCEMKRLYVAPAGRGRRVGFTVASALIEEARRLGYARMLLDTLPSMARAQALYASLGFRPTAPYRFNPVPGASFLALQL